MDSPSTVIVVLWASIDPSAPPTMVTAWAASLDEFQTESAMERQTEAKQWFCEEWSDGEDYEFWTTRERVAVPDYPAAVIDESDA